MKYPLLCLFLVTAIHTRAQTCSCEKEFLHVKKTMENSFAGFPDYLKKTGQAAYNKQIKKFAALSRGPFAGDNCPLIIYQYLQLFKSNHLGIRIGFDATKTDTAYAKQRPRREISAAQLARLKTSTSWEGIYYFTHDSSYKIAVIKDPTPLHDYVGVLLESKFSHWEKGMIKFEGKLINDSLMRGLLYMRNHRPKIEGFSLNSKNNKISGDWQREGTAKTTMAFSPGGNRLPNLDARLIGDKTFYLRIGSFEVPFKPELDSILKANESLISSKPHLIIDLRNNGGGSDNLWAPLIPYLYTRPITYVGVDILASGSTINGWKEYLGYPELGEDAKADIRSKITLMEKHKDKWVSLGDDIVDSSYQQKPYPQKIVVLVNKYCGSSTEEFILAAKQSSKVIIADENTTGNLDYSNVVETPFSCFPYMLNYASTRSRRLNKGGGIDNIGIAPDIRIEAGADWIREALRIMEK